MMDSELTFTLAFLAGLAGAGHCWAMCGGFAGALFLSAPGWRRHLGYHLGRVLAYTLIGALAAALGRALVLAGGVGRVQAGWYVLAGGMAAALGGWAAYTAWRRCGGCGVASPHPPSISPLEGGRVSPLPFKGRVGEGMGFVRAADRVQPHPPSISPLEGERAGYPVAGLLNGFMPCSLVFSLALKAAAAPSIAQGAGWLLAFGLGTVPAMAVAGLLAHGLGLASLRWLRIAAGLLVMALGVEAVVAGAKLFHVLLHL